MISFPHQMSCPTTTNNTIFPLKQKVNQKSDKFQNTHFSKKLTAPISFFMSFYILLTQELSNMQLTIYAGLLLLQAVSVASEALRSALTKVWDIWSCLTKWMFVIIKLLFNFVKLRPSDASHLSMFHGTLPLSSFCWPPIHGQETVCVLIPHCLCDPSLLMQSTWQPLFSCPSAHHTEVLFVPYICTHKHDTCAVR